MGIFQWIIIGILGYAIYHLIAKYERKILELTRLIELNYEETLKHRKHIEKHTEDIAENKSALEAKKAII